MMELTGIPKRHSPAAFRTCRNAGNSVLTAEGTTLKGTGSINCKVEICIFTGSVSELYGNMENLPYGGCPYNGY
jgi:hypothetical protein